MITPQSEAARRAAEEIQDALDVHFFEDATTTPIITAIILKHFPTPEARAALADAPDIGPDGHIRIIRVDADKLYELATTISETRAILAGSDVASLPHDYPLQKMAEDRMADIKALHLLPAAQPTGMQGAFEAWMRRENHTIALDANPANDARLPYYNPAVNLAWHAWQARQPAAVPEALSSQQAVPFAYAYRYPGPTGDVIRFSHGEEINGSKPIKAIPLYTAAPSAPTGERAAGLTDEERTVIASARRFLKVEPTGPEDGLIAHLLAIIERLSPKTDAEKEE